jgi:ethanolamine utilization protein EutN
MFVGKIIGTVVATRKDPKLEGRKLLIVQPLDENLIAKDDYLVAVDTVSAGYHEQVLVVQGSSARMAFGMKDCPVDSAIIGIVDSFVIEDKPGDSR